MKKLEILLPLFLHCIILTSGLTVGQAQSTGSIQATLKNWDGSLSQASRTKFIRYLQSGGGTTTISGSNPGTFTGVPSGSYWVEGYQLGAFSVYEYWGTVSANVTTGNTTLVTINRYTPYIEEFWFEYNGTRLYPTDFIPPGSTVTPKAKIRNRHNTNWSVYVNIGWRYGTGAEVGTKQSSTVTVNANSTFTITFTTITLSSTAEGDLYTYTKTTSSNADVGWNLTDTWDWTKMCSIKLPTGQIVGFMPPPTALVVRGATLQTTVQVKNNTSSSRSFWVGLSFSDPTATGTSWPVGYYDIQPLQTPTIDPGQTKTVVFTFNPHKNLIPGQYYAITKIWDGFDEQHYLMKEPLYDNSLNYPQWTSSGHIGLASFSLGSYEEPSLSLLGQISYAITKDFAKSDIADIYQQRPNAQKPLLVISAGKDIGSVFGIPISAGGSVLIDLADLLGISPEGTDWVTVWVDAEGALQASFPPRSIDIFIIPQNFNFNERALADQRLLTLEAGSVAIPGLAFTALSCDATGCDKFRLQWNGSASFSLTLIGVSKPLTAIEVNKSILRNIFLNNPSGISTLFTLRDYLISAFNGLTNNIRTATLDDGDWELISYQREAPLQLGKAWSETSKPAHYFFINVPSNASLLKIQTSGGSGNVDLYVKQGSRPTTINAGGFDDKSTNPGNTDSVTIQSPQPGRWYIMLPTPTSYSNVELLARIDTVNTSVEVFESPIPLIYKLSQNYPNPFNPTTTIAYQLKEAGYTYLAIYDVLGREVAVVVNEFKNVGYYTAQWDAHNISSGIYFYRITVSGSNGKPAFVETKRMAVIK